MLIELRQLPHGEQYDGAKRRQHHQAGCPRAHRPRDADDIVPGPGIPSGLRGFEMALAHRGGTKGGVLILVLSGRLGFNSAGIIDAVVARAVGAGDTRLVIDLSGVDYLSSAGLHALSAAAGRCLSGGGALALCGLTDLRGSRGTWWTASRPANRAFA